ncbi:hypothetical protein HNR46_004237 [Haloferula luteola]|uniref:Uncharacterized protein n=1 Tax=Haloferula luteola TaxID=595692 RepID=A0A840VA55_9BACT|nr:hypothetical protein [Haloferula luteola]MBB5353966.1 hypothetical protein [Haloferula luteola]
MQATQHISREQLAKIVEAIFGQGEVIVKEASSRYDSPARAFSGTEALNHDLDDDATPGFRFYSIYYPEAGGHVYERRIELIPEKCDGHTHRFKQEGWGLIRLQCRSRAQGTIECNIAVNSEVRAANWSDAYPDMKDPAEWDWNVVKSKAGRLVRLLRKLGQQSSNKPQHPTA